MLCLTMQHELKLLSKLSSNLDIKSIDCYEYKIEEGEMVADGN
jgi:hypothetical protein